MVKKRISSAPEGFCSGKKGFFVTFEGTEGSGKSTQAALAAEFLARQGWEVVSTREPGGTAFGCRLREMLLTNDSAPIPAVSELFLYCADRAQHIQSLIRPALAEAKCVICDRFSDATIAYQAWGRGLPATEIERMNALACDGLVPDLTILLDICLEDGLCRALERNREKQSTEDRFERETLDFHQRVRRGYLALADANPHRFRVIAAHSSPQQVHRRVIKTITDALGQHI